MLIVFDLDDTLIDTHGSILPQRHRECVEALAAEGFALDLKRLHEVDDRAENSKQALVSLLGEENRLLDIALRTVYGRKDFPFQIALTPGVKEVLPLLRERHTLALLTYGDPEAQREKIEKAGLDKALFSTIVVCREPDKGPHYKAIFDKFGEEQVLAVGDRVERDLRPAKELGATTALIRWGRGRWQKADPAVVDVVIESVQELITIVEEVCLRQAKLPPV